MSDYIAWKLVFEKLVSYNIFRGSAFLLFLQESHTVSFLSSSTYRKELWGYFGNTNPIFSFHLLSHSPEKFFLVSIPFSHPASMNNYYCLYIWILFVSVLKTSFHTQKRIDLFLDIYQKCFFSIRQIRINIGQ